MLQNSELLRALIFLVFGWLYCLKETLGKFTELFVINMQQVE